MYDGRRRAVWCALGLCLALSGCEGRTAAPAPAVDGALPDGATLDGAAPDIGRPDAAPDAARDAMPDGLPDGPVIAPGDPDADGLDNVDEARLGTDPAVADTDGDGVLDGAEVDEGTDPLDPASASAWQPRRVERPRLYMGPGDLDRLRAAVAVDGSAHQILYARLRALADRAPPDHPPEGFDTALTQTHGRVAEAAALVGLLEGRPELLHKAADLLARPFPDPTPIGVDTTYDIREAQALAGFCSAFDLLDAAPGLAEARARARSGLVARIDTYRGLMRAPGWSSFLGLYRNNHTGKVLSALGLCALAVSDRPDAAWEVSLALTGLLDVLLDGQGPPGAYAEGWAYLSYGSNSYLPFMAAWHRFAGGRAVPATVVGTFAPLDRDRGRVISAPDPVTSAAMTVYAAALSVAMPDGLTPPTDDGDPLPHHWGLLAGLLDDGRYLWWWAAHDHYALYSEVATLATLDPALEPAPPGDDAGVCAPEGGYGILRSGRGLGDDWLLAVAEHGQVRRNGWAHEHPDATSLIVWAHGEPLLIDSGYSRWDDRLMFNRAADHNLVLVDGVGPPQDNLGPRVDSDAWLEGCEIDAPAPALRIRSGWAGVGVHRWVVRLAGAYVVADTFVADAAHTYAAQWHGNGGAETPDGDFEARPAGGVWSRPGARLMLAAGSTLGELTVTPRVEEHATGYGQWTTHIALSVEAEMASDGDIRPAMLTALVPDPADAPPTAVTVSRPAPGVVVVCARREPGGFAAALNGGRQPIALPGDCPDLPAGHIAEPGLEVFGRAVDGAIEVRRLGEPAR